MDNLHIMYVPVEDLHPADYNPRTWDTTMEKQLTESMSRFGMVDPLIVNGAQERKNVIIGGHFRWHIAKQIGRETVPVVYVSIQDIAKEKELNLRLNRNSGAWDFEMLKEFDIEMLLDVGFNNQDLTSIWDDILQTEDDGFDTEKALEEIKEPKAKPGDLYQLGRHRLLCGDSTKKETIEKLVGTDRIHMVYSDSPYNINLDYNKGIGGKGSYGGKQTKDGKTDAEFQEFLKATMENALFVACKDIHMFYWCDEKYIGLLQGLYEELGITNRRALCPNLLLQSQENTHSTQDATCELYATYITFMQRVLSLGYLPYRP